MRAMLIASLGMVLSATLPLWADAISPSYKIEYDGNVEYRSYDEPKKKGLFGTVRFRLLKPEGVRATEKDQIVILEDGKLVKGIPLTTVEEQDLTTILVLDVSGSMANNDKIGEAKRAAGVFLDMLGERADTGLILFDHLIPINDPSRFRRPSGERARFAVHRQVIRGLINDAKPLGGTAYLDATAKAIDMLRQTEGRRAVVLMTDGVDLNSRIVLDEVIKMAQTSEVPVYTLGIGEAGRNEPVTTVLVLDQSGSMASPANDTDKQPKIAALHQAATQFVQLMRPGARTTLLPFSTEVSTPGPFSTNKASLVAQIRQLQPKDGTSLYDATLAGIETLVAEHPPGKRAVVVLTDGKDESPGSRSSDQAVIERAKEVGVKVYMLGLGRSKEINEPVMRRIAQQTGGEYYHAGSAQELIALFEKLSIDLHDDGIDEASLRKLAEKTGGTYHHVRDVSKLQLVFREVAESVQSEYSEEFKSARDVHDGTARKIVIRVDSEGQSRSNESVGSGHVRGLVVPEQSPGLYLVLLGCVAGCLALPWGLRALKGR